MNEIAAYKNTRRRKQYRNQRINFELIKNLNSDFINFKQKKHIYRNNIKLFKAIDLAESK